MDSRLRGNDDGANSRFGKALKFNGLFRVRLLERAFVNFAWDDRKRARVLREHGLDFNDVQRAFQGPAIHDHDTSHSQAEDRWRMLGILDGEVILVVYTERGDTVRLIAARKATPTETRLFHEQFFGEPL